MIGKDNETRRIHVGCNRSPGITLCMTFCSTGWNKQLRVILFFKGNKNEIMAVLFIDSQIMIVAIESMRYAKPTINK